MFFRTIDLDSVPVLHSWVAQKASVSHMQKGGKLQKVHGDWDTGFHPASLTSSNLEQIPLRLFVFFSIYVLADL